jgi:hypothetical protein
MPLATLQLFYVEEYDHPLFDVAVHGILVHFSRRELLFSCMNAFPLYGLPFLNIVANIMVFAHTMFVCAVIYVYPHSMITSTSTPQMLSDEFIT